MSTTTRNWAINSQEHKSWLDVPSQHRREPKTAQFSGRLSCSARLEEYCCVGITTLFLLKMGVDGPILPSQSISITAVRPPPITLTLSPQKLPNFRPRFPSSLQLEVKETKP